MKIIILLLLLLPSLSLADGYRYDNRHYKPYHKHYYSEHYRPYHYNKHNHHNNNNNNHDLWIGVISGGVIGYILGNTFPVQQNNDMQMRQYNTTR